MDIGIGLKYKARSENGPEHDDAISWCKGCIQKRIDISHLEDKVDWNELKTTRQKLDELWYKVECRLPLKDTLW